MGILDPHELIPHLIAITASTTPARKTNSTVATTSLLQQHVSYQLVYIEHLKKLGVVSLNSSSKSKGGGDDSNNNNSSRSSSSSNNSNPLTTTTSMTAVGGEGGGMDNSSFSIEGSDPIIAIFRALLAVGCEWDTAVAFLAHAAYGSELVNMAKNTVGSRNGEGEEEDNTMHSAIDLVVLAACTLSKGVAEDIASWVDSKIDDIVLVKDDNENAKLLAELSSRLLGPLTALAKSGRICAYQNLYIKLCRIYSIYTQRLFKTNNQQSMKVCNIDEDTMSVLTNFLVPSLSLFPPDTTLPDELWSVLTNLPYDVRYKLYSTWRRPGLEKVSLRVMSPKDVKIGTVPKPLANIESEIQTGISFRKVFRRISKENIAIMGRQLAQTSHNNPLVVFTDILDKIESYDNMILMMVDTFQFITKLGLDVMGYCLLVSLGGGEDVGQKNRTKSK
jgi:THO complex subunit 2